MVNSKKSNYRSAAFLLKNDKTSSAGLPAGAIVGIVIDSVLVAGLGGFALVWFVIKKKTWADFVAIFKKK